MMFRPTSLCHKDRPCEMQKNSKSRPKWVKKSSAFIHKLIDPGNFHMDAQNNGLNTGVSFQIWLFWVSISNIQGIKVP